MNRDIKFRAWVKDRKAIFEVVLINYVTKKVTYLFERVGHLLSIRHEKFNDIELMQYTGLKDKNGKEIFEGDIVKFKDCSIDGTKEFYNIGVIEREGKRDELVISQLIFEKSYFTENYIDFINETFELSEIIGNIYENPELLKEKEVR